MSTGIALATCQIKNNFQDTNSSLQYSSWKGTTISQGKLEQRHFPRTTRQSTSSSIILNIPFNKKNHLLTGVLVTLQQNTGMIFQST